MVIVYASDGTKADLVFNNTYKAPAKPSASATPSKSVTKTTTTKTQSSPKTGDAENMMLYAAVMAAAMAGIVTVLVVRKRTRN